MKGFWKGYLKGFKSFGHSVGTLVNTILLSVVYLLGVGVTALASRVGRKRFIETKVDHEAKTYWSDLHLTKRPMDEYYRQF